MPTPAISQAETQIRGTGSRVTQPRIAVLAFLLEQHKPLTHHEIQQQLPDSGFDPVTLYRVLDWLSEHELVHRIAGANQVWRFSAGAGHHAHEHAHFQCTHCEQVTCFTDMPLPHKPALPAGFRGQEVDYLIKGLCPHCAQADEAGPPAPPA